MDLPFAQKRWCGAAGVDRVKTYSDHREAAFGMAYGVLIKELRLLARAVFVVDKAGTLRYVQLVKELANEPNYDEVLKAVAQLMIRIRDSLRPQISVKGKQVPCRFCSQARRMTSAVNCGRSKPASSLRATNRAAVMSEPGLNSPPK